MRVLVTGGKGLIGRHAVAALRARGVEVHAPTHAEFDVLTGDATALMARIQPHALLHMAWVTKHGAFWHAPENAAWVEASKRLVSAFLAVGGTRVVAAGSCAEYDWTKLADGVCREQIPLHPQGGGLGRGAGLLESCVDAPLPNPPPEGGRGNLSTPIGSQFPYGVAKDAFRRWLEAQNVSSAWGRVFLVFGPGENERRLVPSVIRALKNGEVARVSHGNQVRDFMPTWECGRAFAELLLSDVRGAVNVASGEPVTIRAVVEMIRTELGGEVEFGAVPAPEHDPAVLVADVVRLREEVGFQPEVGLREAIKTIVSP